MPNVKSVEPVQVSVASQLKHEFWKENMQDCPDQNLKSQVLTGLDNGVDLGCADSHNTVVYQSWPSAIELYDDVSKSINEDLAYGRVVGPWTSPPVDGYTASPLGAFKRAGSDKVRVIHDLSHPPGFSVNDSIDPDLYSLQYITVDQVAQRCASYSTPGWLAKSDLSNAFKHVVVKPSQWKRLGFVWDGKYYCYTVLSFGCRSAPYHFNVFADALEYIACKLGASRDTYHYLDDTVTCSPTEHETNKSIDTFNDVARKAGFTLQPHKCTRATQRLEFLGIEIDTLKQTLSITEDRMNDLVCELQAWQSVSVCTKRQLLSIIGKLSFAAKVVRSGRTFLRRLIDLSKTVKYLHYKIKLNKSARADFNWWLACIKSHNGVNIFPTEWTESNSTVVYTDASDMAAGVVVNSEWSVYPFQGVNSKWLDSPIHVRELLAVCIAVSTFHQVLSNKKVIFMIDNMAICYAVNAGTIKCPESMNLIRSLYYMLCKYNIDCKAQYIRTDDNVLADSLSRLDMKRFHENMSNANKVMTFPVEAEYLCNDF